LGEKSWANVRAFILFDVISKLEVNFHKSMLVWVNVPDSWLTKASMVMNFKTVLIHVMHLGLPIGCSLTRLNFCYPLVDRIKIDYQVGKVETYNWMVTWFF
jgi:hypothetical protein